ncbi:MAG: DUF1579 domain-containing protein [Planctomycetota bacterium]|jgi:hypothetical protein
MTIRLRNVLGVVALVGATTFITTEVVSQQHEDQMADMQAMMDKWMEYAQPGEEHAELAKAAGTWKQSMTHWMYPGAEPQMSTSTAEFKSIMGGRFMIEKMRGEFEMNGEPYDFEGLGIFGFDNMKQKHFYVWIDNMGTLMMTGEGERDADGDVVYFSELPNPMSGGTMKVKSVSKVVDDDHNVFQMFEQLPDGNWHQTMEIDATRQ